MINKFGNPKKMSYLCKKERMKFNILKTRKGKLEQKIKVELEKQKPNLVSILESVEIYEKDNLETINKLKRVKKTDLKKINGAIKQFLNAHPILTKELTGSLSKRIYGALLGISTKPVEMNNRKKKITWRMVEITIFIGMILYIIKTLI